MTRARTKKMKNKFFGIFSEGFKRGQFIRLKENQVLQLYLGKDSNGRFALEFLGHFTPTKLLGSAVISVAQTKTNQSLSLCFSLENPDLLEYFCTFCEDLVNSTIDIVDDNLAYKTLCARYSSWKKLFKPNQARLTENEVIGLIGELLYLRDVMFNSYGFDIALESWTGPEYTHKDFSLDDTWHEVKTISVGKREIRISSLEQLDSDVTGTLAVYELERMSPSFHGIKLNAIVTDILSLLPHNIQKESFLNKISQFGYDFSTEYDNFVFAFIALSKFKVDGSFPRLTRSDIPSSIQRVQYDIILSELDTFKIG